MAVGDLIERVVIETRFLPPLVIDRPLDNQPGPPNPLLSFLKPKITITTPVRDPIISQPYGDPVRNYWPEVKIGLIALGAIVAGMVAVRLVK